MNIALFAGRPASIARRFITRHHEGLSREGVQIRLLVIDANAGKQQNPAKHAWNVVRRQARISGCSSLTSLLRIVFYKTLVRLPSLSLQPNDMAKPPGFEGVETVTVPTLNSPGAVEAARACDLVCLMGTRIIRRDTLLELKVPVINIHASDPGFVRGGPPVFWEILGGLDGMTLTIHDVVPEVDAGEILKQRQVPIQFRGSLGRTIRETMSAAEPHVTDLFRDVILDLQAGRQDRRPNPRGPLRVTPTIRDTLKAELICRRRTGRS